MPSVPTVPTVLILDDDPIVLRSLTRIVRSAGFQVIATTRPREAMEAAVRGSASLVISDLHMPEMLGTMVLSMIARSAPETGRVLLTSDENFPRIAALLAPDTAHAFVAKVHVHERLPTVLRGLVERQEGRGTQASEHEHHARALANGIVRALALRDYETEAHCHRVAALAARLASEMGISGRALLDVEFGALLHDMGKIGVRDAVLLKPGKLTDEEWVEMRRHPQLGAQLLADMPLLAGAVNVVQNHHERWLGGGYPRNLSGEQIPLCARIFQIADAFDAIVSDRPYRKGQSPEIARSEIARGVGTQFDPGVARAFEAIAPDDWNHCWSTAGATGVRGEIAA